MQSHGQLMPRQRQHIHASMDNILALTHTGQCTFSIISTPEGKLVIKTSDGQYLPVEACSVYIKYNPLTEVNGHNESVDLNNPAVFQELMRLRHYIEECEFTDTHHEGILLISFDDNDSKSFLEFRNVLKVIFSWRF
jgi:hypothetical protein